MKKLFGLFAILALAGCNEQGGLTTRAQVGVNLACLVGKTVLPGMAANAAEQKAIDATAALCAALTKP